MPTTTLIANHCMTDPLGPPFDPPFGEVEIWIHRPGQPLPRAGQVFAGSVRGCPAVSVTRLGVDVFETWDRREVTGVDTYKFYGTDAMASAVALAQSILDHYPTEDEIVDPWHDPLDLDAIAIAVDGGAA